MKSLFLSFCLLLFSQLSFAQEWVRQNPFPFLSQMHDINFDGPYGLAVGTDATIYTTTNSGKTWVKGKATDSTKVLVTVLVVPGTAGKFMLAGGDNNLILSEDGGKFWKTTYNYIPNTYKVQSLPDGTLIALGSDFGLKSFNKGKIWFPFNMPGVGVTAGHFTSIMNGWVALGPQFKQQVWVTTNGGTTWSLRDPLKHSFINSIQMVNNEVGYLASTDFIYQTTDGGNHWLPLQNIAAEGGISDLCVVAEGSLWSCMNDGSVYFSIGGTWTQIDPKLLNANKTLGIWANLQGEVWMVGKYSSILYSPNFGKDWTDQIPAAKQTMFSPSFANGFVGMVGGSDGAILRTTNGGAIWEKLTFPVSENFQGLEMINDQVVIAGSKSGKVSMSLDQGNSWNTIGAGLGPISNLKSFNQYETIVTTENGKIFKTTNSGSNWTLVFNNAADHLVGIDFFDHATGWVTGWNGKVLVTHDEGDTWTTLYKDKINKFSDVHFTSYLEGWVISSNNTDTIWHTLNGGSTWQKNVLPVKTSWNAISFKDAQTGWIAGGIDSYGVVLRTDNGGASWYTTHVSPEDLLGVYAIPGQETVWAVGYGGNIVKYKACTSLPQIVELRVNAEPCTGDTVSVVAEVNNVDKFEWTYPTGWILLGNSNSSSIQFIAGPTPGNITLNATNACQDSSVKLSATVTPVAMPDVVIALNQDLIVSNTTSGYFQWLLNGEPIAGANDFQFQPIVSGSYQLMFTTFTSGCVTTSNVLDVTVEPLQNGDWVRQNPFPFLSQMYDVDFDGKYGLAVGADAAIFTTSNGGRTWIQGKGTDSTKILTTAFVVPGHAGQFMLAGGDNNLIMTKDGGKLWTTTNNYIPNVYKIESLSDGTLLALGSDFGLRSTDDGLLWFPFNMPGMGVTAGHFTSVMNGWVAYGSFNNAQVYITTDGGTTWNILDPQKHAVISSIDMIDDQVGYLASRDFVFKTIDGGVTWTQLQPVSVDGGINDLHVADGNNLWTSLNNGSVYFSTNSGASWREVNPNVINSNKTLGIWANANGEAWTVGKYISILYTPDYGVTWSDQIPASKQTLFEPNFYDEFVGMVGGSDGTIMRTKNSGAKWEPVKFSRNENFFGLNMIDDNIAIAGSTSGKVFLTEDQGDTWTVIGENLGQITDLKAFNQSEIFVTIANGKIYRTTDGGGQWDIVYNNPSDQLFALEFADHQTGWVVGWKGKILVTADGGDTWQTQYEDGRNHFNDVHFTSPTDGWAVSSSVTDTIWHTSDGGQNWIKSQLPVTTFWRAVSFMDQEIGWVAGGSNGYGVILRTDNGGASWYLSHESPDALLGIYAVPGQETAWATGFGGNIMKYSSCSAPPSITEIRGNLEPCAGDTINFVVDFSGVDLFDWTFPSDWFVLGNSNTSSIQFVVGTDSGFVTVRGRDACGDSTAVLTAVVAPIIPPELAISLENDTLVSGVTSGLFQWLFNGAPIIDANDPTFHPFVSGTYQLHLTTFTSGCETFSNEIDFIVTGTKNVDQNRLLIYPNPASQILYIKYSDGKSIPAGSKISLINTDGKIMISTIAGSDHLYVHGVPPGMYIVRIENSHELLFKKITIQ